ncbi:SDR family oxidoreductase [Hydrogenophaga sp.]|uniref:SDR family NAD(P)-dependent oxidoreductase n=1 Tax=Hydrogenophaga sp. TaxID=1904254 RepID=UPI0025BE9354|nr:SDR family oxidoreductase [Hydrogenophaga sp.]
MTTPPHRVQTALITGASSGIGAALADQFARAGFNLVLVARSGGRLQTLADRLTMSHGVKTWPVASDLSDADAPQRLAAAMRRARRPIDVLVNCAGVLHTGAFSGIGLALQRSMIDLNIIGLTAMVAEFAPAMAARGQGRILNVASIAAFQPVPSLAVYAATKAYVLSLTESLSEEFKGTGVSFTALCPGITATQMLSSAAAEREALAGLPDFLIGDADEVAQQGYEACMRGDVICVPGWVNQAVTTAGRAAPKWLLRRFSGAIVRRLR